jgi:hypothetical protein
MVIRANNHKMDKMSKYNQGMKKNQIYLSVPGEERKKLINLSYWSSHPSLP